MNISRIDLRSRVKNIRERFIRRSLTNSPVSALLVSRFESFSVFLSTTDKTFSPNSRDNHGMEEQRLYLHVAFIANITQVFVITGLLE